MHVHNQLSQYTSGETLPHFVIGCFAETVKFLIGDCFNFLCVHTCSICLVLSFVAYDFFRLLFVINFITNINKEVSFEKLPLIQNLTF